MGDHAARGQHDEALGEGRFAHHPQALLVIASELFSRLPVGLAVLGHKASEHLGLRELLSTIGRKKNC